MIELFAGLHGWGDGALAEGYRVVGFDLYDMCREVDYPRPDGDIHFVRQDVMTLHGSQFRDAALIVASPPCQAYSYRAMPWSRARALPPPDNALFDACFRIQREAIVAAGRFIPLVVENVRGAQKWVGRSRWNFGSYHLWGDVPALMPIAKVAPKVGGISFSGYGEPGYKAVAFNDTAVRRLREEIKGGGGSCSDGRKHRASGAAWFDGAPDKMSGQFGPAKYGSKSKGRRAASALIARIPFELARHVARAWKPVVGDIA